MILNVRKQWKSNEGLDAVPCYTKMLLLCLLYISWRRFVNILLALLMGNPTFS